jgi:hypothetical protein
MNIEFLNWLKVPQEKDYARMKKIIEDKPVMVIVHIDMDISQGNSLCSYLYLKQSKNVIFSLFFFFLLQNWRTGGQNRPCQRRGS